MADMADLDVSVEPVPSPSRRMPAFASNPTLRKSVSVPNLSGMETGGGMEVYVSRLSSLMSSFSARPFPSDLRLGPISLVSLPFEREQARHTPSPFLFLDAIQCYGTCAYIKLLFEGNCGDEEGASLIFAVDIHQCQSVETRGNWVKIGEGHHILGVFLVGISSIRTAFKAIKAIHTL
jgi:hypothetical protein